MACHNVWLICQKKKFKKLVVWFHERTNDSFTFKEIENYDYVPNIVIWKFWKPLAKWIYTQIDNWWVFSLILGTTQHWFLHIGPKVISIAQRVIGSFFHMVLMFNLNSIIYCKTLGKWNSKVHMWILDSFHHIHLPIEIWSIRMLLILKNGRPSILQELMDEEEL